MKYEGFTTFSTSQKQGVLAVTFDFGSVNVQGQQMLADLNSLASSFGSWSKIKASYRFFANPRVTFNSMLEPHIAASLSRLSSCSTALVLQDTTYFDFSAR